ncbi:ribonuclease Z [soil metagenome]
MIEVCLLGCGGMMPLPDRPLSATAIRIGGQVILFDCGEGTQVSWRASSFSYRALGTILISHVHADHIAGLPGILFQIAFAGREEPVRIIGPEGLVQVVDGLMRIVGGLPFDLQIEELDGGESLPLVGETVLSTRTLQHRRTCLGYVIDLPRAPEFLPGRAEALGVPVEHWKTLQQGGAVDDIGPESVTGPPRRGLRLSLISDTALFDALASFVAGSDLLICESTYVLDEDEDRARERGHLTMRQATQLATEANVERLWLTHFSPKVENPELHAPAAVALFPGTEIGRSGLSIELNFP